MTVSYVDDAGNPDCTVTGLIQTTACSEGGDAGDSFIISAGASAGRAVGR